MPSNSYYDILEVSPKASVEVIRAAYKSLMQRHHPDKSAVGSESTAMAASIAQAYEVLSDPQRRQMYDQSLLLRQLERSAVPGAGRRGPAGHAATKPGRSGASRANTWYAPVLILTVIMASGAVLYLSGKKHPQGSATQPVTPPSTAAQPLAAADADPSMKGTSGAMPANRAVSAPDDMQTRTIAEFMTDVSVNLAPDSAQPDAVHVLRIPSFGLRISAKDADRWVQEIQAQRAQIIERVMAALTTARYRELVKPDRDLYLKRLLEETVARNLGLDRTDPLPIARPEGNDVKSVEALLPSAFSVQ